MPTRKYIAAEHIEIGSMIIRSKKWYQRHWRVTMLKLPWDIPIGVANRVIPKGQIVEAKDIALEGTVMI